MTRPGQSIRIRPRTPVMCAEPVCIDGERRGTPMDAMNGRGCGSSILKARSRLFHCIHSSWMSHTMCGSATVIGIFSTVSRDAPPTSTDFAEEERNLLNTYIGRRSRSSTPRRLRRKADTHRPTPTHIILRCRRQMTAFLDDGVRGDRRD